MGKTRAAERRERLRRQVRALEVFYKKYQNREAAGAGARFVSVLLLSVGTVLVWVPYQTFSSDESILSVTVSGYLLWMGIHMYMRPLAYIVENRRNRPMQRKLQYLPVDRRSILYFQAKRLLFLLIPLGLVLQAGQCAAAYLSYGRIELCNALYPLLAGMAVPGGMGWVTTCIVKYKKCID